jgi:hypothetical protein
VQSNDALISSIAHATYQFAFDERMHEIARCGLMQGHTL